MPLLRSAPKSLLASRSSLLSEIASRSSLLAPRRQPSLATPLRSIPLSLPTHYPALTLAAPCPAQILARTDLRSPWVRSQNPRPIERSAPRSTHRPGHNVHNASLVSVHSSRPRSALAPPTASTGGVHSPPAQLASTARVDRGQGQEPFAAGRAGTAAGVPPPASRAAGGRRPRTAPPVVTSF